MWVGKNPQKLIQKRLLDIFLGFLWTEPSFCRPNQKKNTTSKPLSDLRPTLWFHLTGQAQIREWQYVSWDMHFCHPAIRKQIAQRIPELGLEGFRSTQNLELDSCEANIVTGMLGLYSKVVSGIGLNRFKGCCWALSEPCESFDRFNVVRPCTRPNTTRCPLAPFFPRIEPSERAGNDHAPAMCATSHIHFQFLFKDFLNPMYLVVTQSSTNNIHCNPRPSHISWPPHHFL